MIVGVPMTVIVERGPQEVTPRSVQGGVGCVETRGKVVEGPMGLSRLSARKQIRGHAVLL